MNADAPEMLSLKMEKGSWDGLKDRYSILLSSSSAEALFGETDPLDKMVMINNKISVKVTGVYEDLPPNTHFKDIKFFSTWDLFLTENDWIQKRALNDWKNHFLKIYVSIPRGSTFKTVESAIKDIQLQNIRKLEGFEEQIARNPQVFLHPMENWHLYPFKDGITDTKPLRMVWLVGIIGMFVLVLACINFMNLSTARSEKKSERSGHSENSWFDA